MMTSFLPSRVFTSLLAIGALACSSSTDAGPADPTILIAPHVLTALPGGYLRPTIRGIDSTGRFLYSLSATWVSTNPSVATVDTSGAVHTLSSGSAVIIASNRRSADTLLLTVGTKVTFKDIRIGPGDVCGWTTGDDVYCWGNFAIATPSSWPARFDVFDSRVPVLIVHVPGVTAMGIGFQHLCAAASAVVCWGHSGLGMLGNGTVDTSLFPPTTVPGISNPVQFDANAYYSCALLADHTGECWGYNEFGQIGDSSALGTTHPSPTPLHTGVALASISTGQNMVCGLSPSGLAYCWGQGYRVPTLIDSTQLYTH